jgi:hypothetical protein
MWMLDETNNCLGDQGLLGAAITELPFVNVEHGALRLIAPGMCLCPHEVTIAPSAPFVLIYMMCILVSPQIFLQCELCCAVGRAALRRRRERAVGGQMDRAIQRRQGEQECKPTP